MENRLITDVDEFFSLVKEMGEVAIKEVSHLMKIEMDLIERWAKSLSNVGLLSMHYPVFHSDRGKVTLKYRSDTLSPKTQAHLDGGYLLPRYY